VKDPGHRLTVPVVWPLRIDIVVGSVAVPEPDLGWPETVFPPLLTHTVVKLAVQLRSYVMELNPEFPKPVSFNFTE